MEEEGSPETFVAIYQYIWNYIPEYCTCILSSLSSTGVQIHLAVRITSLYKYESKRDQGKSDAEIIQMPEQSLRR
jgi:hypothetical protein